MFQKSFLKFKKPLYRRSICIRVGCTR